MPDRIEVQGIPKVGLGAGRDSIEVLTPEEQMLEALHVEREGYQRRVDRGEEQYGGEDISAIMARIDEQIDYYAGHPVPPRPVTDEEIAALPVLDPTILPQVDLDEKAKPVRRLGRPRAVGE